jgi:hypothetical protein
MLAARRRPTVQQQAGPKSALADEAELCLGCHAAAGRVEGDLQEGLHKR